MPVDDPVDDIDEAEVFANLYQKHAEVQDQALVAIREQLAKPPLRVDYQALLLTIHALYGVMPQAVSAEQIRHALHMLGRKHGTVELDSLSCEAAGVDLDELAARIRRPLLGGLLGSTPRAKSTPSGIPSPESEIGEGSDDLQSTTRPSAARAQDAAIPSAGRPHGVSPNMDRHQAIAEIVSTHAPLWRENPASWKRSDVLTSICTDLDAARESDDFGLYEIPVGWRTGKSGTLRRVKVRGWADALEQMKKKMVTGQIGHSLKMVRKHEARRPTP
jgi:hypothetical protein